MNPDVSRSGPDRCLRRHGVSNLKDLLPKTSPEPRKTFKAYEPGFLHVDLKYLPQMADETTRRYLFVAIDRATWWVAISPVPLLRQEGKSGRLMRRQRPVYPAAAAVDFCTAVQKTRASSINWHGDVAILLRAPALVKRIAFAFREFKRPDSAHNPHRIELLIGRH